MVRLVSNPINRDEKRVNKSSLNKIDEIQASIMRGELLRYSLYIKDVRENLDNLKQANIKYLDLVLDNPNFNYSITRFRYCCSIKSFIVTSKRSFLL